MLSTPIHKIRQPPTGRRRRRHLRLQLHPLSDHRIISSVMKFPFFIKEIHLGYRAGVGGVGVCALLSIYNAQWT